MGISPMTVQRSANEYLAHQPRPAGILAWQVAPGTGSPDDQTTVVRLEGQAEVPFVGALLATAGRSVTITVESRARAQSP